jgi:hypothetical protein
MLKSYSIRPLSPPSPVRSWVLSLWPRLREFSLHRGSECDQLAHLRALAADWSRTHQMHRVGLVSANRYHRRSMCSRREQQKQTKVTVPAKWPSLVARKGCEHISHYILFTQPRLGKNQQHCVKWPPCLALRTVITFLLAQTPPPLHRH